MSFEVVQRKQIRDLSASITKISQNAYAISKDALGLSETDKSIAKDKLLLSQNQILLEQQRQQLIKSIKDGTAEDAELNKSIADSIAAQVKEAQNLQNKLSKIAKSSKKVSDNFGVGAFKGLDSVLDKFKNLTINKTKSAKDFTVKKWKKLIKRN